MTGGDWLGRFCQELTALRHLAADHDDPTRRRLEQLVRDASAGQADPGSGWDTRLVQLLRDLGIPAAAAERTWPARIGGTGDLLSSGPGDPSVDLYRCPQSLCPRRELRRPGGAEPRCALVGRSLTPTDPP